MSKLIIGLLVALIVGTGGVLLRGGGSSSEVASTGNQNSVTDQKTSQNLPEQADKLAAEMIEQPTAGTYELYSDARLAAAQGTKRILFFHAQWCGVCKFFEAEINEKGVPAGITVLQIDYDSESELKKKYGVQIQSTFVLLDDNGEIVKTWPFGLGLTSITDLFEAV